MEMPCNEKITNQVSRELLHPLNDLDHLGPICPLARVWVGGTAGVFIRVPSL